MADPAASVILLFVLVIGIAAIVTIGIAMDRGRRQQEAHMKRRCLACGYEGEMRTWLSGYNWPQFLALVLLCFWVIPGLLFIGWAWGKYKCPQCGTLAKNAPAAAISPTSPLSARVERPCPWCAEPILAQALVCKHCGREVAAVPI